MYEEKTFENILNEMLEQVTDVDTSEGSLMYEACSKIALTLEKTYADLSRLYDNLSITEMEEEFFEKFATDRGVSRIIAKPAQVLCKFEQDIELGTRFNCGDYDYTVISIYDDSGYEYIAECDTAGTGPNANVGDLEPIDYVEDWKGGVLTKILKYGTDIEEIEAYKQRFKELRYNIQSFAGNKAAYKEYITKYNDVYGGVADCIPFRTTDGKTINVYAVDSEYKALNSDKVTSLQNYIDPTTSTGEGDGIAPIGHSVVVMTPTNMNINVAVKVDLDTEYTWEGVKDSIKAKIEEYLLTLRKLWSKNKKCIVRVSQIEYAVLSVQGVIDCASATVNGSAKNIEIAYSKIPVMGELTNG